MTEPDQLEPTGHDPGRPFPPFTPIDPHAQTQAFTSTPAGPGPISNPRRPRHPEQGPPPRP
ncbi:MAG: hypothetical protein ICV72_13790 [Aldersonia sp.]|nr:hypothetical protein [Aldersonia sp.]